MPAVAASACKCCCSTEVGGLPQKGSAMCSVTFLGREVRSWLQVTYQEYLPKREEVSREVKAFKTAGIKPVLWPWISSTASLNQRRNLA